ncbi:MAG: UDP-N-acetylmuramate--L-alanine ligase, partial [Bacteroidaceae bacterium]|nr:UDP-N-acetylmuramate--L-alanine ligase [Bacteroidaceae bacterium]
HLYSRTNDFYREFAEALSLADEVYLTEIYPARELPIPGVTSQLIYDAMSDGVKKQLVEKDNVLELVKQEEFDLLVILGAGDLDNQMGEIAEVLSARM